MDSNNWRAAQGQVKIPAGESIANPGMEGDNWRTELQPESRQRVVNDILETLKRRLPFNGQDGLHELKNMAVRFEEMIYTAARSQQDYFRKFALKMLTIEPEAASNSRNPHDSASQSLQSQIQNEVQQLSIPMVFNQSQVQQQLLSQNNILSTGVPNSVGGMSQGTVPDVNGKNPNMQNMSDVTVNAVGNSMGQGVPSNNCAKIDERKLLLLNKLWSDIHLCVALAETSTERLLEFLKVINELKEILTIEQQSSSTSLSKKQRIEAFCGTAPDEIAIHPPVQSENKGGEKRKKSGQENSIEETCGERARHNTKNLPKGKT